MRHDETCIKDVVLCHLAKKLVILVIYQNSSDLY